MLTPEDILARYGDSIDECLKAAADPQYEFERQIQINKARMQWQMVLGNHFLAPGLLETSYGEIVDFVPFDGASLGEENGANVKLCRPINFIGGDCYKFIAVMGNSAPRVKAVADDPSDTEQLHKARNADANLRDIWRKQHVDRLQRTLAFHQYTTGPAYIRTVWVTDERKYGQTVEPSISLQEGPDGVPVPVEGPPKVYKNGDVEIHIYSVFEVSHPYMAKTLDECSWFTCEVQRLKWDVLSAFAREDGTAGPLEPYRDKDDLPDDEMASSNVASEARESVANPSRIGRAKKQNYWRVRETWLHPCLYEAIRDPEARATLKEYFPDGLYVCRVGSIKVKCENRKLTDEWAVCKTGRGEKILEDPISTDSVPIQRTINDLFGMAQETLLRAISQTIIDSTLVDRESWSKKDAVPAEILLTALPVDGDISKRIYQIPPTRLSDQWAQVFDRLRAAAQDITGIRPELVGEGQPTNTFREAKQRKDQALMQLSPHAQEVQYAWEKAGENSVRLRAKYGSGTVKVSRQGAFGVETDVVDMADLSTSGWHCEADDNWPMTAADQFDRFYGLIKEFPSDVVNMTGIMDDLNLEHALELLQIPGFASPLLDQKMKTLADIEKLLAAEPIDGQPGPDGSPGPKQPSIPPDPYDDHAFVAKFVAAWMRSATGQKAANEHPAGFANVQAFWQAHQQLAQPPAPPAQPPIRSALNVSAKLEEMPPQFADEILRGAGLPPANLAPPPPSQPPSQPQNTAVIPAPAPAEQPGIQMGSIGQEPTPEPALANPLPPLLHEGPDIPF
jgi:hypothetical protein